MKKLLQILCLSLFVQTPWMHAAQADPQAPASWQVGTPIVTYWCGPSLTDGIAQQMAEGGFNLVWCGSEKELDIAHRHGLRGLLTPASLDDPNRREQVKSALVSYDHYQFRLNRDSEQYFLNLAMIRRAAQDAGVPFLNIVQACTWAPDAMRVPNANELRYLVYSTLAYGAQGVSYYVYACANHHGSLVSLDGTPGPLYHTLKSYNREFAAIARELQPLRSLGVYHTSMREPGCEPLPADASFRLDSSNSSAGPRGFLLGSFGAVEKPTHAIVVNLDYYTAEVSASLVGPGPRPRGGELELFDAATAQWTSAKKTAIELTLPPGGGKLVRIAR